jgi:hypothetical protein
LRGLELPYSYFRTFGLSSSEFEFTTQTLLVFSLPVLTSWEFLAVIIAVYLLIGLVRYFSRKFSKKKEFRIHTSVLILTLLLAAKLLSDRGIELGERAALHDMGPESSLPMVNVTLKATATPKSYCAEIQDGEYRLFAHGKKLYYFVLPVQLQFFDPSSKNAQLNLCAIPEDSVEFIELQTFLPGGSK